MKSTQSIFLFTALFVFAFVIDVGIGFANSPAQAAPLHKEKELRIYSHIGSGTHRPDLEDKYFNDAFFGGLYLNGFGYNTEWTDTSAGHQDLGVEYYNGRYLFQLEIGSTKSRPSYASLASISGGAYTQMQNVDVTLYRGDSLLSAGYDMLHGNEKHSLYAVAGLSSFAQTATYDRLIFNQYLGVPSVGKSLDDTTEARASGLALGIDHRYALTQSLELQTRFLILSMSGQWTLRKALIFTGPSLDYSMEDGDLSVFGSVFSVGINWRYDEKWLTHVGISSQNMQIQDKNVVPLNVNSAQQLTAGQYVQQLALTYPGSSNKDRVFLLNLGASYCFDMSGP